MAALPLALQTSLESSGAWLGWLGLAVLHVLTAAAVHNDARHRVEQSKPLAFMGALLWSLAALLGGLAGLGLYWLIHYSTLRDKEELPSHL